METTTLRQRRMGLLEKTINRQGSVLDVRHWETTGFCEIDLHLPGVNMHNWQSPPHIKCRVAPYHYRDYTPARWNVSLRTCTLFIDTSHEGAGVEWAKSLSPGDTMHYIGVDDTRQKIVQGSHLVMIGDQSAIGHFNGLQQLAASHNWISGMVVIPEAAHRQFAQTFPELPLDTMPNATSLLTQLEQQALHPSWQYYLAGNSHLVVAARKILKARGCASDHMQALGFWK
ncbi:SIP domain-containing protein [Chitinophaga sp.]|uniref:SIP domain-containing protein n=1 Tax=Chitinophaga sp. TaxID=1869181 RepID=UPI0031D0CF50